VCERLDTVTDLLRQLVGRQSPPPADGYLDAAAVAKLLNCSVRSVRTWEATGILPKATRFGRLKKWPRSAIEAHARGGQDKRR
jgi:hypothetical protein